MALRLNLACGTDVRDDWVNLDCVPKWPNMDKGCDILWDARTDKIPFQDNTVDQIYAGYLLLHLAPQYHGRVLAEIRRVLKPTGQFQIGEVDMAIVLARYTKNPHDVSAAQLIWGEQGSAHGTSLAEFDKHCHGFTELSLRDVLAVHGFTDIQRVQIHHSNVYYELTLNCRKMTGVCTSVVMPTMRVGGLDVVCEGLERQTFRNFELVIADSLYQRRRHVVTEMAKKYSFAIKHVQPEPNPLPVNAFCKQANTGLMHASGRLVHFITDYTWLPPDALELHLRHYMGNSKVGLMSPHQYVLTPFHGQFPPYGRDDIDSYVNDLDAGKLDPFMWSAFEQSFTGNATALPIDPIMGHADPKLAVPTGPIDPSYFHAKNESCAIEPLLQVNGWDEALDGTHCWQDTEIAFRLAARTGLTWELCPNVAYIVNPRHAFPFPKRLRPIETNKAIYERQAAAGFPTPNTDLDLRAMRLKATGES